MKPTPEAHPRVPRPPAVTWVVLGGLTFAASYLGRLVLSLTLPPLPLSVPRWYLPLTGAAWGGLALVLGVGLWRRSAAAYRWTFWATPAYLIWYWADRLLFMRSDYAVASQPAALVLTGGGLVLLSWALTRPSTRAYFRENRDD